MRSDLHPLVREYLESLVRKAPGTITNYERLLHNLTVWIAARPGSEGSFHPELLTRVALETYINHLEASGYSLNYQRLALSAASGFARWLIEEKDLLRRNPARRVEIPAQALMAPRVLDDDQRYILRSLVEREGTARGEALFALGFYAGCRVSDVSWLEIDNVHLNPRSAWMKVGYKGNKQREIDLAAPAREALAEYLDSGERKQGGAYVFTSQRAPRLTEAGIHYWFKTLKTNARKAERALIENLTFHDLRHDFAHRAREAGWTLEELAYYLGHVTKQGAPAIQTTARYTQVSRAQLKAKVKLIGA